MYLSYELIMSNFTKDKFSIVTSSKIRGAILLYKLCDMNWTRLCGCKNIGLKAYK